MKGGGGVYVRYRLDGSLFNLRRLKAHTKTQERLTQDLLFADDAALVAHTERALQRVTSCFPDASRLFGLEVSLKKTEVLHQPAPLYIHFVDFEKAFNSVHRESLWSIIRSYGIPCKMVKVIAYIYEDFECAVIDGSETSDWFKIKSGVKEGCMMSGFLFSLALDWTTRKATTDKRRRIWWNFATVLEDLDFADDIALLSSKFNDLQEKTGRLTEESSQSGP